MTSLSTRGVVDQMVAQLSERRRAELRRSAAYLALARAILSDEQADHLASPALERQPTAIGAQVAA